MKMLQRLKQQMLNDNLCFEVLLSTVLRLKGIHLIHKRLSSELLHCALRIVACPDRKAPWM